MTSKESSGIYINRRKQLAPAIPLPSMPFNQGIFIAYINALHLCRALVEPLSPTGMHGEIIEIECL